MSSLPLSDHDTLKLRLLEADLVTGAMELATMAVYGIPEGRVSHFHEEPQAILLRLFDLVAPSDLSRVGGGVWLRTQKAWKNHGRLSWDLIAADSPPEARALLRWYEHHGLGIGLHAPGAARKLLGFAGSIEDYRSAQGQAAEAAERAAGALHGV